MMNILTLFTASTFSYFWSLVGPSKLCVNPPLVDCLELSEDYLITGLQDLNVVTMSIPGKERDAGNIWEVEEMRLLNGRAFRDFSLDRNEIDVGFNFTIQICK